MPAGYAFRPRAWALALAATGCATGIALGNWQSGRADQKKVAAASVQRVDLRGRFDANFTVYLDNKTRRGRPGFEIVQPLRLAGGKAVAVDRGWIPAGPARERLPDIRTPDREVVLSGVRLVRFPRAYAPGNARPQGKIWQNVTLDDYAAWTGLSFEPWVVEQHSALDDGLLREWPAPDFGVEMHESYALQW
ncbi:MAG: SURF1 family protein, partial [Burkholderiales bacterium]